MTPLEDALRESAEAVDATLESLVPAPNGADGRLFEAMRYSLFAGGKRLRPFLVLSGADLFDVPRAWAVNARRRHRDGAHLFPGSRRPAGDG